MIIIAAITLVLLAGLNKYLARSFLYPPVFFSMFWAGLLFLLALSGDAFYEISVGTLAIYLLGALMFSVGGFFTLAFSKDMSVENTIKGSLSPDRRKFVCTLLDIGLLILVIALPFYVLYLQQMSNASGIDNFWIGLRAHTSTGERAEDTSSIFTYLTAWGTFIAFASLYANTGVPNRRYRTGFTIALVLLYQILSMARTGFILTVIGLFAINWITSRRFDFKVLLFFALILVVGFSIPAILLNKGGDVDLGIVDNIVSILEMSRLYLLGGLVAFDSVVSSPQAIQSELLSFRFFLSVAKAFGADVNVPNLVLGYTMTPVPTNVYTIYFPYYADFGIFGVVIAMFVLGVVLTGIYRSAVYGNSQAVILHGVAVASLVLSIANETFLTTLSFWIQAVVFTFILYRMPIRFYRGKH